MTTIVRRDHLPDTITVPQWNIVFHSNPTNQTIQQAYAVVHWLPPPRRICSRRCLSISNFAQKLPDLHDFFMEGWQWANEQMMEFWWRSGSPFGYRDSFRIHHYWKIWKVVNGHKSAAHTDSPDVGTDKTCLGRGMR